MAFIQKRLMGRSNPLASAAGVDASVGATGVEAIAAVGTVTVTGTALIAVAGVSATAAVGTPVATGTAIGTMAGVEATSAIGVATETGTALVSATGVEAQSALGTATAQGTGSGDVTVDAVGVEAVAAVGTTYTSGTQEASSGGWAGGDATPSASWVTRNYVRQPSQRPRRVVRVVPVEASVRARGIEAHAATGPGLARSFDNHLSARVVVVGVDGGCTVGDVTPHGQRNLTDEEWFLLGIASAA